MTATINLSFPSISFLVSVIPSNIRIFSLIKNSPFMSLEKVISKSNGLSDEVILEAITFDG